MVFQKKSIAVVFQMLLYGKCYENVLHLKAYRPSIAQ
jgi:hypothetical protein